MSERKHTPGQWVWREGRLVRDERFQIAGVYGDLVILEPRHDLSANPNRANARLIAAAPNLLAACEALVNWYETNAPDVKGGPHAAYEMARDAIAKAEGKS